MDLESGLVFFCLFFRSIISLRDTPLLLEFVDFAELIDTDFRVKDW
jgi:hypothetical protein